MAKDFAAMTRAGGIGAASSRSRSPRSWKLRMT